MKKYAYLFTLFFIIGCKDTTDNVNYNTEYCAAYPLKQIINWDYLKDINFSSLKPVDTQNYLKNTSEEKIIYGGDLYLKIKATGDGDCFIRSGNFILLERLALSLNDDEKNLRIENLKSSLKKWWPYRNQSLQDPGLEKISDLIEILVQASSIKDLSALMNNSCIDLALNWLMRDLSWAYYNFKFINSLNDLKKFNVDISFQDENLIIKGQENLNYWPDEYFDAKTNYVYFNAQERILEHRSYDTGANPYGITSIWKELFQENLFEFRYKEGQVTNPQYAYPWMGKVPREATNIHIQLVPKREKRGFIIETTPIHADILFLKDLL